MKRLTGISRLYSILSILLAFLMVFGLLPHEVLAQNLQSTFSTPVLSMDITPTPTPTATPKPTPTPTSTTTPKATPNPTPTPTPTPSPTPTAMPAPSATPNTNPNIGQISTSNKVTIHANPDQDNEIKSNSKKLSVKLPKGALTAATDIFLTEQVPGGSTGMIMVKHFELNAFNSQNKQKVSQFKTDLQITIQHDAGELKGLDTRSLHLYYFNQTNRQWEPVNSRFDPQTLTLSASTTHFSDFGEFADPLKSGPGLINAFQNDLQSGAATGNYPIEVPPGPGGFQPKISLNYNSGIADEMKNLRDVGSWVGIGWSLNLGSISYDEGNNTYFLELNGTGYKLVFGSGSSYYTFPDQFIKITRNGNQWDVWDRDGNYYRFGGTTDSQEYHDTNTYYCWNLSRMQSANDNARVIDITYTQDVLNNTVRSAYPSILKYTDGQDNDTVRIYFNSSFDYSSSDGNMRYDTPKGTVMNPAPPIVENKKLDSIEVKVNNGGNWQLIRKYYLTYNYTNATSSDQYGGTWYSGTYTLASLTQKGADDSTSLPATTFTYANKQTYIQDTAIWTYIGNPGNPASFNWPHLTVINNGYGGTITYTYTQIPDTSVNDIWTREAVTGKTTDPSIGTAMTTTYSYIGNPQYLMTGWNARYRGFSQVQETDAAGNYVIHYFNTVDTNDGDAEKLTGLETKTEWYDSSSRVLRKVENQYNWNYTAQAYSFMREWGTSSLLNGPKGVTVGSDGYIYVADTYNNYIRKFSSTGTLTATWGTLGSGNGQFYNPGGVAVDNSGYVYVTDTNNHRIQKFTNTGSYVTQWGTCGNGNGQFYFPGGIAVDNSGYVYVSDTQNHRIQKFSSAGSYVTQWGTQGSGNGQFYFPGCISVGSNGYIYVVDTYNYRIQIFTNTGSFISKWGTYGNGYGQFCLPYGITVDNSGYVYVTDNQNHRTQKFTSTGTYVTQWGTNGNGNGQFNSITGIAAGSDGYIYIADVGSSRIQKFTNTGSYVTQWGTQGGSNGQFNTPLCIQVGGDGYLYVTDVNNSRIQKFTNTGSYVTQWGTYGNGNSQFNQPYGIAVDSNNIYVADTFNNRVQKFTNTGSYITQWGSYGGGNGQFNYPMGIMVDNSGYIYVADSSNNRIQKFTNTGSYVTQWGTYGNGDGQFNLPWGLAVDSNGYVWVADVMNYRFQKFTNTGSFISYWGPFNIYNLCEQFAIDSSGNVFVTDSSNCFVQKCNSSGGLENRWGIFGHGDNQFCPGGIAVGSGGYIYIADESNNRIKKFTQDYSISLTQVKETNYVPGNTTSNYKTSQIRYVYDSYGNIITEYHDGDTSTSADDTTVWRAYYPNTSANILDKPARERDYATTVTSDSGGANLKKETDYYYDGNNTSLTTPPTNGNLTRVQQYKNASDSVSSYFTYDSYGNKLTEQDPNGNTTSTTYDSTYHTYPQTKTYPITGLSESYTYDPGTNNLTSKTDVNGQTTSYEFDTFKRLIKTIKPGDSSGSPSIQYAYNSWGTLNSQNIQTTTKMDSNNNIWQANYFDGLGRVVQTQAQGESGHTIISSTASYNNRGQVDKQYVSQDIGSSLTAYYTTGINNWKYTNYAYDGLSRVTQQTNPDSTSVSHDYSTPWQTTTTNERGYKKNYYFDAFQRVTKIEELNDSQQVYATTNYSYDTLGNLTQAVDNSNNTTSVNYDWLSRKTGMTDPDMGSWSYVYDNSGNLTSQTDAKSQTITLSYDALNRLTGKTYPAGSGMTNVAYTYDDTSSGNYGKGKRTGMSDAVSDTSHPSTYKFDNRGRLIQEVRLEYSNNTWNSYTTQYTYDGLDRIATVTYPTGEVVTNGYNGRGLPYSLSGGTVGSLVTSVLYNGLGSSTEINLANGLKTSYGYYGTGGSYDTTGGYYGKLWEIKSVKSGNNAIQDVQHTWDAGGNLTQRQDLVSSETENFAYDYLDRLTGVSGAYSQSYSYNALGNITNMNGNSYTYGTKPHAVTAVGATSYAYDNNGNTTTRGSQTLTWDVENRPITVTGGASFIYDGDGNRVKKTENSETIVYINKYYEKNLTTSEITTHYYLGDKQIAVRKGTTLSYVQQDSLSGTSVISDSTGASAGTIHYFPFGVTRSSTGTIPTDKKFTGQRLDGTGLYYYNARYYDPTIGRFISPDSIVPNPMTPEGLNRYTYCSNNPLKFNDPSGHFFWLPLATAAIGAAVGCISYAIANHDTGYSASGWAKAAVSGAVAGALSVVLIPALVGTGVVGVGALTLAGGASSMIGNLSGEAVKSAMNGTEFNPNGTEVAISFGAGMFGSAFGKYASANVTGTPIWEISKNVTVGTWFGVLASSSSKILSNVFTHEVLSTEAPSAASPANANGEGTQSGSSATLGVGGLSYFSNAPTPVFVNGNNTGFTNWGTASGGGQVISINPPSSYAAWEWF